MKPIIGIFAEVDDERVTRVLYPYVSSIENSGGAPLIIPYLKDDTALLRLIDICDGFFFTGGVDIEPEYYGEEKGAMCGATQPRRDELEFRALEYIIKTDKPILAICRGCQLVNVALGGTLYQDIPTEYQTEMRHRQTESKFSPSHSVKILHGTPLFALTGEKRIQANSFHHQAIKTLGEGLSVMALADDGIIEAVYLEGERYLRAYQWHPERLYETNKHNKMLFDDFIDNCKR